ncbi:MAG TPA: dienelactone hydrolase family protein [Nitrospiria bacterium]|jgi:carboxymethylenebutenolidase
MAGKMVNFTSNGATTPGYLAVPQSGKGQGVIVIQEWWGLVPHIKDVCDRFASEGFLALAPDLYHGENTTSPDEAGRLMMALRMDQAEKDLQGAVQFLVGHSATTSQKVGCVGFCMGGQLALFAASKNPAIGACTDYYGIHPNVKPDLPHLQAPVLGFFGEEDTFVTPDAAHALEKQLRVLGKKAEFSIFPKVGHAFFNDSRKEVYNEELAKKSWNRMLAFFREHLK